MHSSGFSSKQYRRNAIETASPIELVVMLYEAALSSIDKALENFHFRTYDVLTKELTRTLEIVQELKTSLRPEGREISQNLSELYDYVSQQLKQSLVEKEKRPAEEARLVLAELLVAWEQVARQASVQGHGQSQGTETSDLGTDTAGNGKAQTFNPTKATKRKVPPPPAEYDGGFSISG